MPWNWLFFLFDSSYLLRLVYCTLEIPTAQICTLAFWGSSPLNMLFLFYLSYLDVSDPSLSMSKLSPWSMPNEFDFIFIIWSAPWDCECYGKRSGGKETRSWSVNVSAGPNGGKLSVGQSLLSLVAVCIDTVCSQTDSYDDSIDNVTSHQMGNQCGFNMYIEPLLPEPYLPTRAQQPRAYLRALSYSCPYL